jgi:hypothetical protein
VPRLLVLLHGMGRHGDDWATHAAAALDAAGAQVREDLDAAGTPPAVDLTFGGADAGVRLLPLRYDDIFDHYLARDARNAQALLDLGDEQRVDLPVDELWTWLAAADDATTGFLYTHAYDAVMFRFFPEIRKRVVERVVQRIVEAVAEAGGPGGGTRVSFVGHSLGTAVLQQALHRLATTPLPDGNAVFTAASGTRFGMLAMVANVSRVLQRENVHASIVGPPNRPGLEGRWYVDQYHSFRHALDPMTLVRPFEQTPPRLGPSYVQPAALRHLTALDVHALAHYLQHPAVHLHLINGAFGGPVVPRAYLAERVDAYHPPLPSACAAEVAALRSEVARIADRHQDAADPVVGLCATVAEYLALVQRLAAACPQLGGLLDA